MRRRVLATATVHAPHLLDVEVISVFRRLNSAGSLTEVDIESCLSALQAMGIRRSGHRPLLARVWLLPLASSARFNSCQADYQRQASPATA